MLCAIECKRGTGAWVVFTSDDPDLRRAAWHPVHYSMESILQFRPNALSGFLPRPHPTAYKVVEIHGKAGESNPAYAACNQAISAAHGASGVGGVAQLVYPIVVIDAPLFSVTYTANGDESINEVPLARVLWSGSPLVDGPTQIDIVTSGAIESHAKTLRIELGDLYEELERANVELAAKRAEKRRLAVDRGGSA